MIKKIFTIVCLLPATFAFAQKEFHIAKTFHIASPGAWDYLAVNNNKLYLAHGTHVNILDENTGDSLGIIENTEGVHGIAFAKPFNEGFTSNGRLNNVTVFDLNTDKVTGHISTGQNPDAILFDDFSKKIITCNGKSEDLSVIDPATSKVVATIPVGGKPETAVTDDTGKLFVNIEDKNEIVEVNTKTFKVEDRWSLAPAEGPAGLAMDKKTKRLFSGCEKLLVVVDATNGKIVDKLPIGRGCDGVAFDPATKNIFASTGEGILSVIHENTANDYKLVANVTTKPRARTLTVDPQTHRIYLPLSEFEPAANKGEKAKMIPGTFQVLVVEQ